MKNVEEVFCVCDEAARVRLARRRKREAAERENCDASEKERGFLFGFTRSDGVLCAVFCCAVLLLSFLAARPVSKLGEGELDGALRSVGEMIAESELFSPLFAGAAAANAEAEPSVLEKDGQIPVISYIGYASAEQYIASPPEREKEFFGVMPTLSGEIISGFSYRDNPLYATGESERYEFHKGVDIPVPEGSELVAFADGRIIEVGENDGYGIYTVIDHGGGFTSLYAHQSRALRGVGALVRQGEVIGLSGQTGRVTGPHLHFELKKDGVPVDPEDYIK